MVFLIDEKDSNIFQKIEELRQKNIPAALVTVIKTIGSAPQEVGTKMIVQLDGQIYGTVGGSSVEALVIKEAHETIKSGLAQIVTHDLFDQDEQNMGMICGGTMEFFIDPIQVPERVYIFGGGHVGFHVASLAKKVGFEYIIVDDRAEYASAERFPDALNLVVDNFEIVAIDLEITNNDYIIIVTREHKEDYNVLRGIIRKPARYIGMMASKTKRNQIFSTLRTLDGISDDLMSNIHSPIGIDIGAETPDEIAVSIVAELIKVRRAS